MPPRLNKRQQRELEELETLGANASQSEEETDVPVAKARPAFAELVGDDDEQDEETTEVKKKKPKKKKKPAATQPSAPPTPSTSTPKPVVEQSKLSSKKAAKKAKKAKKDELDEALAELSVKYPDIQLNTPASSSTAPVLSSLLTISPSHLDSQAEMRRLFGARVVDSAETSTPNDVHARRRAAALGKIKSTLTKPKPTWPPPKMRDGLTARVLSAEEVDDPESEPGERWWTVEYSKRYRSVTKSFMRTVMAGDPQGFYDIIRQAPWHADTLLQLSELYRHREEHAPAIDFVDRAMFAYERAFVGMGSFGGKNRLDFRAAENRVFYLALHRQTADLARRGCTRTSFEFGKLMYSLDPWTDPHGALLHLEINAVRAGMGSWLVQVYDVFVARRGVSGKMNPSLLPGWAYSRALALYAEDKDKGTKALVEAFQTFPEVAPLLADKLDVSLPESLRGHSDFRIHPDSSSLRNESAILHLLSHYYAQRATMIWKGTEKITWFRTTLNTHSHPTTPSTVHQQSLDMFKNNEVIRYSIYRHTVVLSLSNLFKYFNLTNEMTQLACDPVPPPNATSSYLDEEFFEGVQDPFLHANTGGIVVDDNMRGQLRVLFERFGGGGIDFEQFIERLQVGGEGALMELVQGAFEEDMPQHGQHGEMPGGLFEPEEEHIRPVPAPQNQMPPRERIEDESEDEDEDGDDASMPVRMFRNIVGRFGFWGNNADQDEDSSDDEHVGAGRGARDSDVD